MVGVSRHLALVGRGGEGGKGVRQEILDERMHMMRKTMIK